MAVMMIVVLVVVCHCQRQIYSEEFGKKKTEKSSQHAKYRVDYL